MKRVAAGLELCISNYCMVGHCAIPQSDLIEEAAKFLGTEARFVEEHLEKSLRLGQLFKITDASIPLSASLEANTNTTRDKSFEEEYISTIEDVFDINEIAAHDGQISPSSLKLIDTQDQQPSIKQNIIYNKETFYSEKNTAKILVQLDTNQTDLHPLASFRDDPLKALDLLDPETHAMLSADQRNAVLKAVTHKVLIITGGPGFVSLLIFLNLSLT